MDLREIVQQSVLAALQALQSQHAVQEGALPARPQEQSTVPPSTDTNNTPNGASPLQGTSTEEFRNNESGSLRPSSSGLSPLPGPLTNSPGIQNEIPRLYSHPLLPGHPSLPILSQEDVDARVRQLFRPYSEDDRARNFSPTATHSYAGHSSDNLARPARGQNPLNLVRNYRRENPARRNFVPFRPPRPPTMKEATFVVVYLGDPSEKVSPDSRRHLELSMANLGKTTVACNNGSPNLLSAVMDTFVLMTQGLYAAQTQREGFGFELLYLIGSGSRTLIPVKRNNCNPKDIIKMCIKTLYARPNAVLLAKQQVQYDEDYDSSDGSEFYEVVGGRNNSTSHGHPHNTSPSAAASATSSETSASPMPPAVQTCRPNCQPPCEPIQPEAGPSSSVGPSVRGANSIVAVPAPNPSQSAFPLTSPRVPLSSAGFRPGVAGLPDVRSLRRFIFSTSARQYFRIQQLGPGVYPLNELSRFLVEINPEQRATVVIEGENTLDGGGPLLSYIWKLSSSVRNGDYNGLKVLYGTEGNLTLSSDKLLVQQNVMAMLARFNAFAILNAEVGICGLSRLTVKILASSWWPTPDDIAISDIYDPEAKFVAEIGVICRGTLDWTQQDRDTVRSYFLENDYGYDMTLSSASYALNFAKLQGTVTCRETSLLQFREAFLATDVGRWVAAHEIKWNDIFPEQYPQEISAEEILNILDGLANFPEILAMFYEYFQKCEAEGRKLSSFVEAVTGFPYIIGDRRIQVRVHSSGRFFAANTCFSELRVFRCTNFEEFEECMQVFMAHAELGFNAP